MAESERQTHDCIKDSNKPAFVWSDKSLGCDKLLHWKDTLTREGTLSVMFLHPV